MSRHRLKLCVTTVVDGTFQRYTPLFILSLLTAYPAYSIRVFVRDDIGPELAEGIRLLDGLGDWQIITGALDGYPQCKRLGAYLRYLLFTRERVARYFSGFDYVYITDGSKTVVTAVSGDGTTATGVLAGGTDNNWDDGDVGRFVRTGGFSKRP